MTQNEAYDIYKKLKTRGYIIDTRDGACVMKGMIHLGSVPTFVEGVELAAADYDFTQREYDVMPLW